MLVVERGGCELRGMSQSIMPRTALNGRPRASRNGGERGREAGGLILRLLTALNGRPRAMTSGGGWRSEV